MRPGPSSGLGAVRGFGPALTRVFAAAGIRTVSDLLWHLPHRYEDRSRPATIASLVRPDVVVTIGGRVVELVERRAHRRRMTIVEALVEDGTGALPVVWFNQPYLTSSLKAGTRVWLYGPLRAARSGWGLQMVAPEWEVEDADAAPVHVARVVPIYRRVGSVGGRRIRSLMARVLEEAGPSVDPLAPFVPAELGLPTRDQALHDVHFPAGGGEEGNGDLVAALAERCTPAQRRLAFDELLGLAAVLERAREERHGQRAVRCVITEEVRERARSVLPFQLTRAQRRALAEIVGDLQKPFPMARLLQGDVGAGKTVVAMLAALVVLESGGQVAILAPTELLAQQHHATLTRMMAATPFSPALLVGSMSAAEKRAVHAALAEGRQRFVVGTHALIEDSVAFPHLGLAVIDEQHRFGVAQRDALRAKGEAPHLLVMTATPIPRSLALSLYGDLDVSVIDELPPGRRPVRTALREDAARDALMAFLRREVEDGGRVYWVFPLIEESESLSLRAVTTHVRAVRRALPGIHVGVVHGRLGAGEREEVMAAFAAGDVQVLCATTVIEVGIDVPEASVMVVENAERFGLAQLHQLRGRVGRGARRSFCALLVGEACAPEARRRLEVFASTTDGFRIAEEDFRMRGPGELTGLRQWGRPEFRVASLFSHRRELEAARAVAAGAAASGKLAALEAALAGAGADAGTVGVG